MGPHGALIGPYGPYSAPLGPKRAFSLCSPSPSPSPSPSTWAVQFWDCELPVGLGIRAMGFVGLWEIGPKTGPYIRPYIGPSRAP